MEGGDIMSKHLFDIMVMCFYIYLFFIELSYFYFKTIKKDNRFEKVGFFKYFECPVKTLKGDLKK